MESTKEAPIEGVQAKSQTDVACDILLAWRVIVNVITVHNDNIGKLVQLMQRVQRQILP